MKRMVFTSIMLICLHSPSFAQGFDWGRFNLAVLSSTQHSAVATGEPGILKGHPNQSFDVQLGYRFGKRWETNVYMSIIGSRTDIAYVYRDNYTFSVHNALKAGWGVAVQWHLLPYSARTTPRPMLRCDVVARAGFDITEIEADNVWCGIGVIVDINEHLAFTLSSDIGSFYCSRIYNDMTASSPFGSRMQLGLKLTL